MHFSARGLVLNCIYSVKYGTFFTIARPFLDTSNLFHDFFGTILNFTFSVVAQIV